MKRNILSIMLACLMIVSLLVLTGCKVDDLAVKVDENAANAENAVNNAASKADADVKAAAKKAADDLAAAQAKLEKLIKDGDAADTASLAAAVKDFNAAIAAIDEALTGADAALKAELVADFDEKIETATKMLQEATNTAIGKATEELEAAIAVFDDMLGMNTAIEHVGDNFLYFYELSDATAQLQATVMHRGMDASVVDEYLLRSDDYFNHAEACYRKGDVLAAEYIKSRGEWVRYYLQYASYDSFSMRISDELYNAMLDIIETLDTSHLLAGSFDWVANGDAAEPLVEEALNDRELIGNLSTAENGDERTDRILDRVAEELDFLLEEEARNGGLQIVSDDSCRSVGAVSRTERVVAVDIAVASELLSHFSALSLKLSLLSGELFVSEVNTLLLVILLNLTVFSLVEAGILEKSDFARLKSGYDFVGSHAVGNELNLTTELLSELFGDRLKRERGVRFAGSGAELDALRTAEVAHENEAAALFENILNRRKRGDDTCIVSNLTGAILSHRDVEIDTHYNALAVEFNIAQSLLCHFGFPFVFLLNK